MDPLRIVVNADDLGMSPAVDAAVATGLEQGWLTSASVLANGPTVAEALRCARASPRASFGVHLNLTEFAPLTRGLAHQLDRDGQLGPRSLRVGPADLDAVTVEWAAQIRRVVEAGVAVSHLDSHQHLHHLPVLRPVLTALRAHFGIPRMRGMGALRPPRSGPRAALGALRQRLRAARFRRDLRRDGAVTTDGFASVSVFLAHAASASGLPLTGAGRWRTVELMAHPGNPHSPAYAEEVAALADGALQRLPFPVELVSWREIR